MQIIRKLGSVVWLALGLSCSDGGGDVDSEVNPLMSAAPTVLVDLDPASGGMTFTVENLTADRAGRLFFSDRESGDVLSLNPAAAAAEVVGRIEDRADAMGMPLKGNGGGLVFNAAGDLLIASGSFGEVLRLPAADIDAASPGVAQALITGVMGANALLLDGERLFISGGNTGSVYVAPVSGGAAEVWARIEPSTRSVAPNDFMQSVVANGMALDESGALLVADTARGGIWRIPIRADASAGSPELIIQSSLLQGIDGLAVDPNGRLWAAVNERNALVVLMDGQPVDAFKNDSAGPLEFPAALVFVGEVGYVANFDRARADNLAADGMTSSAGIGASIAHFSL